MFLITTFAPFLLLSVFAAHTTAAPVREENLSVIYLYLHSSFPLMKLFASHRIFKRMRLESTPVPKAHTNEPTTFPTLTPELAAQMHQIAKERKPPCILNIGYHRHN